MVLVVLVLLLLLPLLAARGRHALLHSPEFSQQVARYHRRFHFL